MSKQILGTSPRPPEKEQLRAELLRLIVKREQERRRTAKS